MFKRLIRRFRHWWSHDSFYLIERGCFLVDKDNKKPKTEGKYIVRQCKSCNIFTVEEHEVSQLPFNRRDECIEFVRQGYELARAEQWAEEKRKKEEEEKQVQVTFEVTGK